MGSTNRRASPVRDAAAPVLAAFILASFFAITLPPAAAAPGTATTAATAAAPGTATTAAAPTTASAPAADVQGDDIRDIRGPKGVFPLWLILVSLAAIALLIAGAYILWRWKRRRQRPRPLTHLEIVLQRLEATRPLMQPSTVRDFSIAISDIVRGHIEYAFDVTATQRTTEEFLHDLLGSSNAPSANAALAAHRSLLEEFLYRCDVAKFAGVTLSQPIMESLYQSARRFVIETSKPAATAPANDAPTGHPIVT
jgi:hypothetical protein